MVILIVYTTLYRGGGHQIARAARTLAAERAQQRPGCRVRLVATERKEEFAGELERLVVSGESVAELHFLGHSGMYGPMFGTTRWPEQLSPHEWRTLEIPFAPGAEAWFHACRTARWFAPFFARTFEVPTHGYYWYTTFSRSPQRFVWDGPLRRGPREPLYLMGCIGMKSHGLLGVAGKYAGLVRSEPMKRFEPAQVVGDSSYDSVAHLYDEAFSDIRVRADEWRWLQTHLGQGPREPRLLDMGCGNGALLHALAPGLAAGVGVDASREMIAVARRRNAAYRHLRFEVVDSPQLPFPDGSFHMVVSLCSFRYLDWDPLVRELCRVLVPEGRILVVDMVTAPLRPQDLPTLAASRWRQIRGPRNTVYRKALRRLVRDPRWKHMLHNNPIRAEHELRWYLESRFPGRHCEVLNVGLHARILGFDSGPVTQAELAPQTFP